MRAIFSSSRVETVEGVAAFLRQAGIDVLLRHGRSYHSRRSGQFSYLQPVSSVEQLPSVWVCHSADQARARALLLQAKLVESTRPTSNRIDQVDNDGIYFVRQSWQLAVRMAILIMIVIGLGFFILRPALPIKAVVPNHIQASGHDQQLQDKALESQVAVRVHLQTVRAPRHE